MRYLLAGVLAFSIVTFVMAEGAEIRELTAKLSDKDSDVRRAAAKELAEMGPQAKDAVTALRKAVSKDKDMFVRRYSAEALGKIGSDAKAAIPELTLAMKDEKKEVALAAAEALGSLGNGAVTPLTNTLKDEKQDPNIRKIAATSLGRIGKPAHSSVGVLTDVLTGKIKNGQGGKKDKDKDSNDIRIEVVGALGALATSDDKAAVEALKGIGGDKANKKNKSLTKAASDALRKISDNK